MATYKWSKGLIAARRVILTVFCLDWACNNEGVSPEEAGQINKTERYLRVVLDPRGRKRILEHLARDWADTGEPLTNKERALINATDRKLTQLQFA